MLISTIIPIYNSSKYLERCIDSLLTAQIREIKNEIILVNDGSTDNSLEICNRYVQKHKNIKVISQENQGLSGARNTGMEYAQGKYISFVDSDDTVNKDYFSVLMPYLDGKYNMIKFGYTRINEDNSIIKKPIEKEFNRIEIENLIINTNQNKIIWFVWKHIYKTSFLKNHNINFDQDVKYGEDSVFLIKVYNNLNEFKSIEKSLYNYFENEDSLTGEKFKQDLLIKFEIQYLKRKEVEIHGIDCDLIKKDLAKNYIEHSFFALLNNLKNAPIQTEKNEELKNIRNSIIYKECFPNYKYNWKHPKKSLIIKLFELKWFNLLLRLI